MAKGPTRTRALRNLFRRIPDDAQILNIMFDLTDQPDRVAAIVGSAILEDRLRTTILKYFRNDLGDEGEALLFDDISGPLATFDAKIRLAYAFGMLNADTKRDFD